MNHVNRAGRTGLWKFAIIFQITIGLLPHGLMAAGEVKEWDEPTGPKIIQSLLTLKRVDKTANGKAYEMMANLVGLCELARATGDRQLLEPVLNAWTDILANRLYITGSASQGEYFHGDHILPNADLGCPVETCFTVSWIQLNLHLLQFDTSAGKPVVQIQRGKGSAWESVGELADYPATTPTDNSGLKQGQKFALRLAAPVEVFGVRVLGAPSCGNDPKKQVYVSCAELEAFADD